MQKVDRLLAQHRLQLRVFEKASVKGSGKVATDDEWWKVVERDFNKWYFDEKQVRTRIDRELTGGM
jgi:hypothetical protein